MCSILEYCRKQRWKLYIGVPDKDQLKCCKKYAVINQEGRALDKKSLLCEETFYLGALKREGAGKVRKRVQGPGLSSGCIEQPVSLSWVRLDPEQNKPSRLDRK